MKIPEDQTHSVNARVGDDRGGAVDSHEWCDDALAVGALEHAWPLLHHALL